METPNERLRRLRVEAGYKEAVDFAKKVRVNETTYRQHETGRGKNPTIPTDPAIKYAAALGVTLDYLLTGKRISMSDNDPNARKPLDYIKLPVITWAELKCTALEVLLKNPKMTVSVFSDFALSGKAWLMIVEDEAMVDTTRSFGKSYPPGNRLVYDEEAELEPGCLVVADVPEDQEKTVFRRYDIHTVDAQGRKTIRLSPLNPSFPTYYIAPDGPGKIIGRVVWRFDPQ